MDQNQTSGTQRRMRQEQEDSWRAQEARLQDLIVRGNKEAFFEGITPLLGRLRSFVKRLLRAAYLEREIKTPVYTSDDIVDEAILKAYENFEKKPAELTLEQWLYQLVNETLLNYLRRQKSVDARRRSLETFGQDELRTLGEVEHMTADAEGEVLLDEDLDDAESYEHEFTTPAAPDEDPEKQVERKEEVQQIISALVRVPEHERIVFELAAIEGFSEEDVGRIMNMPAAEVKHITNRVRQILQRQLQTQATRRAS